MVLLRVYPKVVYWHHPIFFQSIFNKHQGRIRNFPSKWKMLFLKCQNKAIFHLFCWNPHKSSYLIFLFFTYGGNNEFPAYTRCKWYNVFKFQNKITANVKTEKVLWFTILEKGHRFGLDLDLFWSSFGFNSPFSLYRLSLDHPPLNIVWKGKLMLVYWERTNLDSLLVSVWIWIRSPNKCFGELLDLLWSQIWFWLQFGFGLAKARPFSFMKTIQPILIDSKSQSGLTENVNMYMYINFVHYQHWEIRREPTWFSGGAVSRWSIKRSPPTKGTKFLNGSLCFLLKHWEGGYKSD